MLLQFEKYQGAGNDFIIIDNRKNILDPANRQTIKFLCDRRFGIGADGLMMLYDHKELDFEMKYFNSDGYEGTMCGNGGRCIVLFANKLKLTGQNALFLTIDGKHSAKITDSNVSLKMNDVREIVKAGDDFLVNTGSPHYVTFRNDLDNINIIKEGREIRNNDNFISRGINVNFVKVQNKELFLRTYERGVEDETLSCGTGAIAAVIISAYTGQIDSNIVPVNTKGGILKVGFIRKNKNIFSDIMLEGPANFVFKGEINL